MGWPTTTMVSWMTLADTILLIAMATRRIPATATGPALPAYSGHCETTASRGPRKMCSSWCFVYSGAAERPRSSAWWMRSRTRMPMGRSLSRPSFSFHMRGEYPAGISRDARRIFALPSTIQEF
jgi:hypothetical protein